LRLFDAPVSRQEEFNETSAASEFFLRVQFTSDAVRARATPSHFERGPQKSPSRNPATPGGPQPRFAAIVTLLAIARRLARRTLRVG
ncbi:MAG: hypothetical protein AAGN82_28955, partial [Myxococcota bacterium]